MTILALVFLGLWGAAAQQASINVQAPNMVAADEQFNVVFSVEGERAPSDFSWDAGSDFQVVWGPQKGSSSSISIVNGKTTRSSSTSYTYILMPRRAGTFTLPRATATVKGDKIYSREVSIQVVGSGSSSSGGSQSQGSGSSQASVGEVSSEDLFMTLSLDRNSVVVGEPVRASLKLYQRANIAGFEGAKFPSFNGFWSQETAAPQNIEFQRENVGDRIYNAALIRSWVLIPQQAGTLTIDPAELVCLVNVRSANAPRSIFDSFFESDYHTVRKRVTSPAKTVKVSALPAGAPSSFGGGVGSFTIDAKLSRDSLKAHDAASLTVTVKGRGNVSLLEAPKVSFPPDFEVYDVKTTDALDKSSGQTSGSRTFEYPFIPRSHGDFEIPAVQYTYFDSATRRYVTLSTAPIPIKVARGAETPSGNEGTMVPAVQGVVRKDVKNLGNDIRFIVTKTPAFREDTRAFVFTPAFWVLLCVLVLLAVGIALLLSWIRSRRSDVVASRGRGASKVARKRLSQAKTFLDGDLYTAFYESLYKAMLGFVSDRLNISSAELTKEHIAELLSDSGIPAAQVEKFNSLLEACEFARYSPSAGHEAMDAHYRDAMDVISFIDDNMKKKKAPCGSVAPLIALLLCFGAMGLPNRAQAAPAAVSYPDSLWTAGVQAYTDSDWDEALRDWQGIEALGLRSVELYYNIGNAFFKQGDYAHAILYYERALKLDPSAQDVQHNLEFARGFVQDRIETVPEFFLSSWLRSLRRSLPGNSWCTLFFVLLALFLASMLIFVLSRRSSAKKTGFFLALPAFVLAVLCLVFAASQRTDSMRRDAAIVTRPVSAVKSTPGAGSSSDLFILHEGTKVRIIDEVGDWRNVELADGRRGWMPVGDMEII